MKTLGIAALIFLVGCAGRPTLEQLEAEALTTGDWTAVEERESLLRRTGRMTASSCPEGTMRMCVEDGGRVDCRCLVPNSIAGEYVN
jgi:hypothetical protein